MNTAATQQAAANFSLEAERALIGSCVIDRGIISQVSQRLRPDDLSPEAQPFFRALLMLSKEGRGIDAVSLRDEAALRFGVDQHAAYEYVAAAVEGTPGPANWSEHATAIIRYANRRRAMPLLRALSDRISRGQDPDGELDQLAGILRPVETAPEKPRAVLQSMVEVISEPREEREFLAVDKFPKRRSGLMVGRHRAGKGSLAVHLGVAASLGLELGPGLAFTKPVSVVYITLEDWADRIAERSEESVLYLGQKPEALLNFHAVIRPQPKFILERPQDQDEILRLLEPVEPCLIFFDNLARTLAADASENDNSRMIATLEGVERIVEKTGACVVILHHTGKDAGRGPRGASSIPSVTDFTLHVDRDQDAHSSTLRCSDDRDGDGWSLTFERHQNDAGASGFKCSRLAYDGWSSKEIVLLNKVTWALAKYPDGVRAPELAEELGISGKTLTKYLRGMERQGKANCEGAGPGLPKLWRPGGGGTE